MRRQYTDIDRVRLRSLYESGLSVVQIAKREKMPRGSVPKLLRESGVCFRPMGRRRVFHVNDGLFSTPLSDWDEARFWLLGFIMADGCNQAKRGNVSISVSERDREVLELANRIAGFEGPISRSKRGPRTNPMVRSNWFSKRMCDDLARLGAPARKTFATTFPQGIPSRMLGHFVRGVLDGDGCISVNTRGRRMEVTIIGYKPFVRAMLKAVERVTGVRMSLRQSRKWDKRIAVIRTSKQQSVLSLIQFLYSPDCCSFLSRKAEKARRVVSLLAVGNRRRVNQETVGSVKRTLDTLLDQNGSEPVAVAAVSVATV